MVGALLSTSPAAPQAMSGTELNAGGPKVLAIAIGIVCTSFPGSRISGIMYSFQSQISTMTVRVSNVGRKMGNTTEVAEFNIYCAPEAAEMVLNAGVPTWLVGLE